MGQTILNYIADPGYEVIVEPGGVTAIDRQAGDKHRIIDLAISADWLSRYGVCTKGVSRF
jgi:hypothetical protein